MLIGYAQAFPHDHTLSLQKDTLTNAGCRKIFTNTISNAKADRNGLEKALAVLRPGDTLVIWKLDRLGTSIKDLSKTMAFLEEQGIGFKSLTDSLDTSTRGGAQIFRLFRALRAVMREKIKQACVLPEPKEEKAVDPKPSLHQKYRSSGNYIAIRIFPLWRFAGSFTWQDQLSTGMLNLRTNNSRVSRDWCTGCVG